MSSPPPLLPSSQLRVATFNIGLGFTRKLPEVLERCIVLSLDIIALQEIGDPPLTRSSYSQYLLITSPGPSSHQAGVGLLISQWLAPRCRAYKKSSTGRLIGVVLELTKGHRLLIVSAYMPTGLDHSPSADDVDLAHKLYAEMATWTRDVHQVIFMGDLNETLTPQDRYPPLRLARAAAAPIGCLAVDGFTDVFRHLHPDAFRSSGFTHHIDSLARPTRSRIDYIWTKGVAAASLLAVRIDSRLRPLSHHCLLWMTMQLDHNLPPPSTRPIVQPRLPDLRAITKDERKEFGLALQDRLALQHEHLQHLAQSSLTSLAHTLTTIVHDVAMSCLPQMGGRPLQSKHVLTLQRQRRDLTRLLRLGLLVHERGDDIQRCPEWTHLFVHCTKQHTHWNVDPRVDFSGWCDETRRHISTTRIMSAREQRRLKQQRETPMDANRTAAIHRMLQSDGLPPHIFSVVDANGELTSSPEELEEVMASHFESVFDIPPLDPSMEILEEDAPAMLFEKESVQREWFTGLMDEVRPDDLVALVSDSPLVSAPGEDGVSAGVWKIAIQESELVREHVACLFTACMETSTFPSAWKTSIILPVIKDLNKERAMTNIRPISLQNCLGKLFNKVLARRLGLILLRYPILNPSQRGYVLGGTSMKCLDELLDAWDWSRENNKELHTIFYDVGQAYDSVQVHVLVRALRRLRLPDSFISLIADSLTGLTSCVRTIYGHTRSFQVRRSVRQGDPLAPLLFVILMDALHDGLEVNPFDGRKHGCVLTYLDGEIVELPSLGYADDTTVLANSLADLSIQNDWVQYFMKFNLMRLNPRKCELIGRKLGASVTAAEVEAAGIKVNGNTLLPLPHDQPIRYLGAHMCFNGDWLPQQNKATALVSKFTRLATKFHLSIGHAVYMFNVFLMPRLELALHYVHGRRTQDWIESLDRLIIGCIKHCCNSLLRLSHSALAMSLHLLLPSWLEKAIKISETFIRFNSTADSRWAKLGRMAWRRLFPSSVDRTGVAPLPGPNALSQLGRTIYLAVKSSDGPQWSFHLAEEERADHGRRRRLFQYDPLPDLPTLEHCSITSQVELEHGPVHVAHDCWHGWYGSVPDSGHDREIDVYTDGSHDQATQSSSWSVVVGDRWLLDNFGSVPSDEHELARQPAHVHGATLFGSAIRCTQGVYPAELQAIVRAMAMFPLNLPLHIHSDSQSSIQSIRSFITEPQERRRLRSASRTILRLIWHLFKRRFDADGRVTFSHVRAHTQAMDQHSVGNRMADFQANVARQHLDRTYPLNLRELPLDQLEAHLHVKDSEGRVIIDDLRRTCRDLMKAKAFSKWQDKLAKGDSSGQFAHVGTMDMGRVVLRHGSFVEQQTFVHVATNTIHFHRLPVADGTTPIQQHQCVICATTMTVHHLMTCPSPDVVGMRQGLQHDILAILGDLDVCQDWLRAMSRVDLQQMSAVLFPPPVAASVEVRRDHHVRCMIGAFTQSECHGAIKLLNIENLKHGLKAFCKFRCVSLAHIAKFYASLNNPLLHPH